MSVELPPHSTAPWIFGPDNRPPRAPSFEQAPGTLGVEPAPTTPASDSSSAVDPLVVICELCKKVHPAPACATTGL